jgi:hypothetical protein
LAKKILTVFPTASLYLQPSLWISFQKPHRLGSSRLADLGGFSRPATFQPLGGLSGFGCFSPGFGFLGCGWFTCFCGRFPFLRGGFFGWGFPRGWITLPGSPVLISLPNSADRSP